jgi:hypothetical protein
MRGIQTSAIVHFPNICYSVLVEISNRRTCRPKRAGRTDPSIRGVLERAIAIVDENRIGTVVGKPQVRESVLIQIAHAYSLPKAVVARVA